MKQDALKQLVEKLRAYDLNRDVRIMEVCGTHTTEFFRSGVKSLFPERLSLVSGPGCPVCVTPNEYLDRVIEIGRKYRPIIATFGDMINVPSSRSSLKSEKAAGLDVVVLYSPMEALDIAGKNPDREIIFLSVGFETTAPGEAITILEARKRNLRNYSVCPGNKLTPPAVAALLDSGEAKIDGFILPGHVSVIIGAGGWRFIADRYRVPCVIAGFAGHDLVAGTLALVEMVVRGKTGMINEYARAVKEEGNPMALDILERVFVRADSHWRGIGLIPESGFVPAPDYAEFNAFERFPVDVPPAREHAGCRCGEVLKGILTPVECALFGRVCSPENPVGPCTVSTEGTCSAYYKYGRK